MKWISVEDELPDTGFVPCDSCSLNVILYDPENEQPCEGWFCFVGGAVKWNSYTYGEDIKPTHWQPLPPPPEDL